MTYSKSYYSEIKLGSLSAAEVIVPLVVELVKPKKVIDVGCGIGAWLYHFKKQGVGEIMGIDGNWVDKKDLLIPAEDFQAVNLENSLEIDKKFDLVVSLEVAEHLPERRARIFIESLTKLGPVILFSAAIPHQGGKHHVNEQWPEYWEKLFAQKGYLPVDCIRKKVWNNKMVGWWYAQNIVFFVQKEHIPLNEKIKHEFEMNPGPLLPIVHPNLYLSKIGFKMMLLRTVPVTLIKIIKNIWHSIKRLFGEDKTINK